MATLLTHVINNVHFWNAQQQFVIQNPTQSYQSRILMVSNWHQKEIGDYCWPLYRITISFGDEIFSFQSLTYFVVDHVMTGRLPDLPIFSHFANLCEIKTFRVIAATSNDEFNIHGISYLQLRWRGKF